MPLGEMHETAKRVIVERDFPEARDRHFYRTLRGLAEGDPDSFWMRRFQYLPDLYSVDRETGTVHIIEVEHTSRMTPAKQRQFEKLLLDLDCEGWECELHVYDRWARKCPIPCP